MFELIWRPEALDELSDIYVARLKPAERDRLAVQVERLNRDLVRDPFEEGESRDDPQRRVSVLRDVTVYFKVVADTVTVFRVHRRN